MKLKKLLSVALGILTAIGGFVDAGDLVTNAVVGSRFGMSLTWAVVIGVLGICVYSEMSGRIAAVSGRATFDLVRERLGPRVGLANLVASMAVTFLTLVAEIGGLALALELLSSVSYLLIVPFLALLLWVVLWRAKFAAMENVVGLAGLSLIVFAVAVWQLGPSWSAFGLDALLARKPGEESWTTYAFYFVALFGAAMTPYEVFFFSSGGVEEHWKPSSLATMRANVFIGFPLGGLLSLSIAGAATLVLLPAHASVESLGAVGLPVAMALGKVGVAIMLLGFVAATFGAACETGLSIGYSIAQYFGFQWGKLVRPREAAAFHSIVLVSIVAAVGVLLTTVDPIMVTEISVVFSAVALPLTYFPILVVANDRRYLGDHVNGRLANGLGVVYLILLTIISLAALPLMIITGMGK
ncbi:NRAMP family divalent metal transporter [Cumulibacter manganitolerans]|uniref:NRAMP family divalent metal transporter n=1 Tax=Cumulibacter manganitolerans TaxID=1884992 RepID=UPI001E65C13C|nr:divalent metal cation transporter [Cumulibacter manganitolerans]